MAVFAVSAVLFLYVELCSGACNSLQFEIDGKCCSMCEPGFYVGRNCTKDTQTRCFPCGDSCYSSEPNHYSECKKCTVCDSGLGLRVKTSCTAFSDSVCEVLDGHYCTDRTGESCSRALRHAPCSPGQFIVNTGTADRDTVCSGCAEGTFSNGSLHTCQTHSHCELMGMITVSVGTKTADSECSNLRSRLYSIIPLSGLLILSVALIINCTVRRRKTEGEQRNRSPSQCEQGNRSLPQCEQSDTSPPQCEQGYKSLPQCEQSDPERATRSSWDRAQGVT
ncbi:tumor necrosis factor receptor superfamily member 14-like [Astyanax mexicanus]|uniref:Tumor necrosis factor receptor superfamily member 5 n=1 Tax=Astyanax mexicanus TaxID=7994 RepID=A0A8T2LHC4_ASTMX|nr:tumor necrosis factor receptor superfamily member 14-like [Astyanax mexicanus]